MKRDHIRYAGVSDRTYATAEAFADHLEDGCPRCQRVVTETQGRTPQTAKLLCPVGRALDAAAREKAASA